jgi:DNA-binding CsgD family transcriptional regulator
MTISRGDDDLIATIYDAVVEPSGWDAVVKRVVEATKSISGGLLVRSADAAHLSASHNIDPSFASAYVETWYNQSPLDTIASTIAPGKLGTATHITQTDSFKSSAYYNEMRRPRGWADVVAVGLVRAPKTYGVLAVQRSFDAIWVEPAEWNLLETIAPHLKRAAAVHELLARTRATTDSLAATVAVAGFAVFLLTEDCRVTFANAKAEDLLRRGIGLRYESGRLATTSPTVTARLHALARQGAYHKTGEGDIAGTLELSRGENRLPLVAHVIPLAPIRATGIFDLGRPAAAVFVVDPAADLGAKIQHFAARFGLTPAETRILAEIIAGSGLPAAATRLNITEATARSYAKSVLSKTGTNRQAELIRRFFETAFPGPLLNA